MNTLITQFASEQASEHGEKTGIIEGLGIDWTLLVFQMIAFLLLVWLLSKFVYPVLLKILDDRQSKIDEGLKAARKAEESASAAQDAISDKLDEARKEARDIVATAKEEASGMLARADEKAKANASHVIEQARSEIDKEVIAAKKMLHNETIDLVADATEKVTSAALDSKTDKKLITKALEEAK